jgi:predicted NBD/HSP70 family sugar kinase
MNQQAEMLADRPPSTATSRDALRSRNLQAVLDAIHRFGPISRSDLRDLLGLSGASLTSLTADLIRSGIVVEAREGHSDRVGRKPILLAIAYDSAVVAGVKVADRVATLVLTNLRAEVIATRSVPLHDRRPDAVADAIAAAIDGLRGTGPERIRLDGACVSLPGVVDPSVGEVRHSPHPAWNHVPFADLLASRLHVPTLIENDVNALAVAEAWFGVGRGHGDFLVLTMGRGVGLGIVIGGQVYRGPRGGAGELGHAPLARAAGGAVLTVEDVLADDALVAALARADAAGGSSDAVGGPMDAAGGPSDAAGGPSAATEVLRRADAGDAAALRVLHDAGTELGVVLSVLVNLFAPTLIVFGGEGVAAARHLLGPAREALARHAFGDLATGLVLVVNDWGDDAWARGAAGLAASRYLATVGARR